jgi:pyridoxine 5-phosphate synthase
MSSLLSTVRKLPPAVTHFSANINRIALLRNSRDNGLPDLIACARIVLDSGAAGITVHPRPDERHIRASDIGPIAALVKRHTDREFNIEGNPHHNLMQIVESLGDTKPQQVTLVPDALNVPTSNRGFAAGPEMNTVKPQIARLKALGCRVSVFIDADVASVRAAAEAGADRIELYTEPYALAFAQGKGGDALAPFVAAAATARTLGLGVNAGHDLNLKNLPALLASVEPDEVSIGHAFIADALLMGLDATTRAYCDLCTRG